MITDCLPSTFKYFLSTINLVFCIISGFLFLLGLWLYIENTSFIFLIDWIIKNQHVQIPGNVQEVITEVNQPKALHQFGQVFIFGAGSVFVFTLMGYFGAMKESRILLVTYGVFMILLVSFEVVILGIYAGYTKEFIDGIKHLLRYILTNFYSGAERSSDAITMSFNYLMAEMRCCGVDNYTDFKKARIFQKKKEHYYQVIPSSCCIINPDKYPPYFVPEDPNCLAAPTSYNSYFLKGCWERFSNWMSQAFHPFVISLILCLVLEILILLMVFLLYRAVDKNIKAL